MGFTITGINLDPAGLDQLYIFIEDQALGLIFNFLRYKVHLLQYASHGQRNSNEGVQCLKLSSHLVLFQKLQ